MKNLKTHTFKGLDGKRRKFDINVEEKVEGYSSHPDEPGHEIYVDPELSPRKFLDCAVHEATHAIAGNTLSEKQVNLIGTEVAKFLWRLDYRREDG